MTISINDFGNIGDGINAYIYEFSYNNDSIQLIDISGTNNWKNIVFNEENGNVKVASTSSDGVFRKQKEDIFKVTFEKTNGNIDFKIKSFEVAAKINGKLIKVEEDVK